MTANYKLSSYIVLTDLINPEFDSDPSRLLYATRTGKTFLIKDRVYSNLKAGDFTALNTRHLATLIDLEAIVPADEDEFAEILKRNVAATADTKILSATIQPTANCQLGCTYCGQVHSKKNLDQATSDKIVNRIFSNLAKPQYERLAIQWFGAEPLMAYREILSMSERLRSHCAERGIRYSAHMITNGLNFKPAIFLKLVEQQIKHFQITLDGVGATHDLMRITKEGKKTFEIIVRNILEVTSLPEFGAEKCGIAIRVNVNRTSVKAIYKLIDRLAQYGLGGKGVTIDFQPIVDWGGNNADDYSLTKEEFAEAEIDWIMYAIRKGFKFSNIVPGRRTQPCMVVEKDAEVFDVSGNVFPCYEFPYTPKYEDARYRIGHVDTIDAVRNDKAVTKQWYEEIKTDVAPCRKCNLLPICGGACPKQWLNGDVACPSYKANIEDKLLLNHLLKQGGLSEAPAAEAA
ncbi:hypothetical protein ASC94_21930 [Massilia sp. Root418]|jgi:uncharacterized protein|uniref:radical SAM/SPASM domain-containing protein n=1 Tax=Massilia sp. Root418 TaxID=1736532 RepID=UPI0006FA4454|nr:radical SAM protein [Massilia sp. Root418]KQW89121.1 hypothetical protein ASC94_21930 [Massilia sp. Root418]